MSTSTVWPYPRLIAHRGAGRAAPENTLASIRLGARHGFRMMEYDVKLSKDGVAILLHDDTLDRTANATGRASDRSYAELANVDAGAWHSAGYAGEPIATLHAIAAFTIANGIASNIEIKPTTGSEAETGRQVALQAQALWRSAAQPPLLSSFSEAALQAALEAAPALPRALLFENELPPDWRARLERLQCIGANLNNKHTTRPAVDALLSAGYTVVVWTVNDLARAQELLRWGCHAIVTDEILTFSPEHFA
ncbi:glycerophosphodiester phosphodiesterase [Pusillimonas sp. TS35]|uniref:glycerophosphodiester phosphodiesterase n=1 Tax=Paracandidimonas lactea TaxID=2895524 RepID=UPI00136A47FC|nr:glycerophosphodiester phosphodiesterase [Paracandidimonas lactea]MYN12245.1 glycerophosphodiester phosphodiesterase [Pusillimonas sp. TS35]